MKKLLSLFIALALVMSCTLPAFATSAEPTTAQVAVEDNKKVASTRTLTIGLIPKILKSVHENISVASEEFEMDFDDLKAEYDKRGFGSTVIKAGINVLNVLGQALIRGVLDAFDDPADWKDIKDYSAESENIYFGRDTYQTEAKSDAEWKLGYASASIVPNDVGTKKYTIANRLYVTASDKGATAKSVLDDQRVRVICVDDGTGAGAVVIAVIDGLGVASGTIRDIREKLQSYVDSGKVASINVSSTHTHSALDTLGVSSPFLYALVEGLYRNAKGETERYPLYNDSFIEGLVDISAKTIETAINNMESGKLYYDTADASKYISDTDRHVVKDIPPVGILRFDPTNPESKETYLANISCHPTLASPKNHYAVSSDYIYYMDKNFQAAGYNFIFVQGAVGELYKTNACTVISKDEITERVNDYDVNIDPNYQKDTVGQLREMIGIADDFTGLVLGAKADGEEALNPVINVKHQEITFTTKNYLLRMACQIKLVDNSIYRSGDGVDDVMLPTEIGYVEFGNRMAFGLYPCEMYPEVFHGGALGAEDSWTGEAWNYDPMPKYVKDNLSENIDLYAMGFANDYIGYVVPDNFYALFAHILDLGDNFLWGGGGGLSDEMLSAGRGTASNIVETFQKMIDDIK